MRAKTMFATQPDSVEITAGDSGSAVVFLRENIEPVQLSDDSIGYQADEYTMVMPFSTNLAVRISSDFPVYLDQAKAKDYADTASAVRGKRNVLLEKTDKDCLVDRNPSDAILAYRLALRDVPEQSGFPYNVVWPELAEFVNAG